MALAPEGVRMSAAFKGTEKDLLAVCQFLGQSCSVSHGESVLYSLIKLKRSKETQEIKRLNYIFTAIG